MKKLMFSPLLILSLITKGQQQLFGKPLIFGGNEIRRTVAEPLDSFYHYQHHSYQKETDRMHITYHEVNYIKGEMFLVADTIVANWRRSGLDSTWRTDIFINTFKKRKTK